MKLRTCILALVLLVLSSVSVADTTYTYSGNPYTSCIWYCDSGILNGFFTLNSTPSQLDNLNNSIVSPSNWSFDGLTASQVAKGWSPGQIHQSPIPSTSNLDMILRLSTNSIGNITSWNINITYRINYVIGTSATYSVESSLTSDQSYFLFNYTIYPGVPGVILSEGRNENSPGRWATYSTGVIVPNIDPPSDSGVVPESASLALSAIGMLIVKVVRIKRN